MYEQSNYHFLAKLLPGLGITTPLDKIKATLAATPLKDEEAPVCLVCSTHEKYLTQCAAIIDENYGSQVYYCALGLAGQFREL